MINRQMTEQARRWLTEQLITNNRASRAEFIEKMIETYGTKFAADLYFDQMFGRVLKGLGERDDDKLDDLFQTADLPFQPQHLPRFYVVKDEAIARDEMPIDELEAMLSRREPRTKGMIESDDELKQYIEHRRQQEDRGASGEVASG